MKERCYVCGIELPHSPKEYFSCCKKYRSMRIEELKRWEHGPERRSRIP